MNQPIKVKIMQKNMIDKRIEHHLIKIFYFYDITSFSPNFFAINSISIFEFIKKDMSMKLILLTVACLILQISSLSLAHDSSIDTCFYEPLGHININHDFKYTIIKAWSEEEGAQIKNKTLNASDFIRVEGWQAYSKPFDFFEQLGGRKATNQFTHDYDPLKNVRHGSDAPEFGLDDASLQFAFGTPSEVLLYQVHSGEAVIALRFQASVSGSPYLGRWSILVGIAHQEDIQQSFNKNAKRINRLINKHSLSAKEVAEALNIIPSFIEDSLFWTFSTSPEAGTTAPIQYDAFLVVLRAGEKFLIGPIYHGQRDVAQIKDLVKDRSQCTD